MAVNGDHVYWTSLDGVIGRAGLDGGSVTQSFISSLSDPYGMAVDGQYAYWANNGTSAIGLANLDFPASPDPSFLGAGSPLGVAVDGQHMDQNFTSAADGKLRWRLTRGKHVYRRGVAMLHKGAVTIRIAGTGRLPHGRYLLRIAHSGQTATVLIGGRR